MLGDYVIQIATHLDNYDYENKRIYYMDLYHSHHDDPLQSISVLFTSLFRLPAFGAHLSYRLN
ncbi:hypothetical protein DSUL_140066 [Desulfovibrionales bacterium]